MGYKLSHEAEEDIINIYLEGISQFGSIQADRYHHKIEEAFYFLSDNPEAAPLRIELKPNIRVHPTHSHIVIYQIEDNSDLFILRVRHKREDWLSHDKL
ncbi:MAG: type II toxin-antitoxin system RelE/ParE family toxin [Thiotrichales bacterium]|nr:type II toxin-antitoxin system RelE/ParE family toxin [Thiotrichales bacterium]MBT3613989.1 type II toxin-antitoxin system RelE/ParE family toxin [Thiotrichales bacterium]MBT3752090.1 type II toxin-antitoxin system RelE/ParE family toxin [Thiotrichales bacterium]MBT3836804.1 type II toxin-antitoxin system RelE/ParE family toxin [Thiotrichales bacterium]MBT4151578.1 type II toxin-antitoxin system RelE/ParE family toxin [Thiotrichales bacterium]